MLKKLLKYDLEWCYKPLVVFYILTVFFAIITRIIESIDKTLIVVIMDKICSGVVIALVINIIINCLMRNWVRFIKNIYKDESYLTHTLPVSKSTIYLSKVLTAVITLFTSFVVIIVCLAIVGLNENSWYALKTSLEESAIFFNSSVLSIILVMITTVFFQFLFVIMLGLLGIIIGYKSNKLKIEKSIGIGFGIYMMLSMISLGVFYIAGLINSDIMSMFNNTQVSSSAMKSTMLLGICIYGVYIIVAYFTSKRLLNKGVNVD